MIQEGVPDQYAADLLTDQYGVYDLRDIAKQLGVSRKRGDTKRMTAERIVAQAPNALSVRETDGIDEVIVDVLVGADASDRASCRVCGGHMLDVARGTGSKCIDCGYRSNAPGREV